MGQYYNVYQCNADKTNEIVYNKRVFPKNEYCMAKLMEHGWVRNRFCRALTYSLINNPKRIAWIGDYANEMLYRVEEEGLYQHFADSKEIERIFEASHNEKLVRQQFIEPAPNDFFYEGLYLINHDKEICINMSKYIQEAIDEYNDAPYPLAILTACGNGLGGGDYFGPYKELAGTWAFDIVEFSYEKPMHYEEVIYCFCDC